MSISLTMLCVIIATTVGAASRNTVQAGGPSTKAGGIERVGAWPMNYGPGIHSLVKALSPYEIGAVCIIGIDEIRASAPV